ncbi:MAG: Crp/Fnr family transcriptional regulator [Pseudomonadota bacterium]
MTPDDLLSLDLTLFDGVTAEDLRGVDLSVQRRTCDPWEVLFNQEDKERDVFFPLSGELLAVIWTEEGREIIFNRFSLRTHFGELAALDNGHRSVAVVARTAASVLVMPQAVFLDLFTHVPVVRQRVVDGLVERVRSLTKQNLELTTFSVEQRVASYLIRLALERDVLDVGGRVEDAPTHSEIAASVGANREMVSRTMTKLVKRGAITSARKQITIVDPEALSSVL